ncbi:MAG TPA: HD domain-containing phosphohydrolase [Acidimicrobiia bacterium]|nr:HD domain-containing phosphohydrolase [Acidimicrobiia bacterium]
MLGVALNAHDRRTRGHSERVRALTDLVAEELRLPPEDAGRLRWGAFLHDIGKLSVPAPVLNKAGKLDAREWHVVQRHPLEGERFAVTLQSWLGEWLHAIGQHHERFDGTGYPDGLRGDEITLAGRIVAVADAYETMTAVRSYNRPKSPVEARRELRSCAGSHFDPVVVRGFMNVSIGKLRWTAGLAAWLAQIPFLGVPMRAGAQMVTSAATAQGSAGAVAGSVLMGVAGVATPIAVGSGFGVAALVAIPAVSSEAPPPSSDGPQDSGSGFVDTGVGGTATIAGEGSDTSDPADTASNGDSDSAPGESGSAPGQSGSTPPGQPGSAPGQSTSNPGNGSWIWNWDGGWNWNESDNANGNSGSNSGNASGHS